MKHLLAVFVAVGLLAIPACEDGLSPGTDPLVRSGTLVVPSGRAGVVLSVVPADAVDSVLIGPPVGADGAYFVSTPVAGNVVVYSDTVLTRTNRFRLFLRPGSDAAMLDVQVRSTASPDGSVHDPVGSHVALD